jgi:alkylhydroperoxidase family enzyme
VTEPRTAAELWAVVEELAAREPDPELVRVARERVTWLLRLAPAPAEPTDERLRAVSAFADQFVIDVAGITPDQRNALFAALGGDALGFVQCLYVADLGTRRATLRARLLDADTAAISSEPQADDTLWTAIETFMRTVAKLGELDPLTSELVRLRGASMHNCRVCRSRRSAEATELAPDRDLLAVAEQFERAELDDPTRLALRLTDAMLTQPTELADTDIDVARRTFTADEIDELLFDVVRNAANKIAVAFGADAPQVTEGVELFTLDAVGDVVTVG